MNKQLLVRRILFSLPLLISIGCGDDKSSLSQGPPLAAESTEPVEESISGVPSGLISSESELAAQSRLAVDGDVQAAERVVDYYAYTKLNHPDCKFWLDVAIENGSAMWTMYRARTLAEQGGEWHCRRGMYMARRAMEIEPARREEGESTLEIIKASEKCAAFLASD